MFIVVSINYKSNIEFKALFFIFFDNNIHLTCSAQGWWAKAKTSKHASIHSFCRWAKNAI